MTGEPLSLTPSGGHPQKTDDPTERWRRHRLATINRGGTLQALTAWCTAHGLDPADVEVTGGHVQWWSPETDEEYEQRLTHQRAADERTEAWERATYARLTAKYGAVT